MSHMETNINPRLEKIKPYLGPVILLLAASLSFGLGRLSKIEDNQRPITIEQNDVANPTLEIQNPVSKITSKINGQFVASKNGTRYYRVNCAGVNRIKEENKIWFQTVEEAKRAGYAPAANC